MLADDGVHLLTLKDPARCRVLVVREPRAAQFLDGQSSEIRPDSVLLVPDSSVFDGDGDSASFDPLQCVGNLSRCFTAPVQLAAETQPLRRELADLAYGQDVSPVVWTTPPLADVPYRERLPVGQRRPVAGRTSGPEPWRWPSDAGDFNDVYGDNDDYDIWVLGDVSVPVRRFGDRVAAGWTTFDVVDTDLAQFVGRADFWLAFDASSRPGSLDLDVVLAMASGAVVVLPPHLEETYQSGAIYAGPSDVRSVLSDLWRNPQRYRRQAEAARASYEKRLSRAAFLDGLTHFTRRPAGTPHV